MAQEVHVEVRQRRTGPQWRVRYTDRNGEHVSIVVRDVATIDLALIAAQQRLDVEDEGIRSPGSIWNDHSGSHALAIGSVQ